MSGKAKPKDFRYYLIQAHNRMRKFDGEFEKNSANLYNLCIHNRMAIKHLCSTIEDLVKRLEPVLAKEA